MNGKLWRNVGSSIALATILAGCGATGVATAPGGSEQIAGEKFESDDYIVVIAKSGDTASGLAARYLNDAGKDWMIEEFNHGTAIVPGQQVVIPKRFWNLSGVSADGYQLVPVLCYHNLAPQSKGRMILAAKIFEDQMRYLKNQGYRVINLRQFVEFVSLKRQLPKRSVLLTFDDGYRSFSQYALPVLKQLGFTATLFIYTDYVGAGGNAFTWDELKKLQQEGFDLQAHSKSHGDMVRGGTEPANEYDKRLEAELALPRGLFQKYLGAPPDILAYPYGRQVVAVVRKTRDRGYAAAFTVRRQSSPSFVDPYRIHRSQIYPEMSMEDFVKNLDLFSREEIK
jgi:peptidoglycan/xylan/chitin deacetylase (PgdA/CDA1 family)